MERNLGIKYYNLGQKRLVNLIKISACKTCFWGLDVLCFECVPYCICRGMCTAFEAVHCGVIASTPILNPNSSTFGTIPVLCLFIAGRKEGPGTDAYSPDGQVGVFMSSCPSFIRAEGTLKCQCFLFF